MQLLSRRRDLLRLVCQCPSDISSSSLLEVLDKNLHFLLLFVFFFIASEENVIFFLNKNKSVSVFYNIIQNIFHYEIWISPTRSKGIQLCQKTRDGYIFRRGTLYSHTLWLYRLRPQMRNRRCTQKHISVSCFSGVRSTDHWSSLLCILVSIPSRSSGKLHNLAVFGNNLWSVPLGKRFLQEKYHIVILAF